MVHTSAAALYSLAGVVATNVLSNVCGSPIDLGTIDIPVVGAGILALFLDMYKRRGQNKV